MEQSKFLNNVKRGISKISGSLSEQLRDFIEEEIKSHFNNVRQRAAFLQELFLMKLIGSFIIVLGVIFLAIGGFYLIREFVGLSNAVSFLFIGVIILLIGFLIRGNERRLIRK